MTKNLIITTLIILNIFTGICLWVNIWQKELWEKEAIGYSKFAAGLWAVSDFNKSKKKKLRLRIENQVTDYIDNEIEFDGDFLIKEWVGYTYAYKILRAFDSPNIQVARNIVNVYNYRINKCYENPDFYKKGLAEQIESWNKIVMKKINQEK